MCMIQNRLSDFHCVYTFIQIVHTEFIKVVCTCCCSAFKSFNKVSQEQTAVAVTVALISEKNKSRTKEKKSRYETVAWKRNKLWILWNFACRTAIKRPLKWLYECFLKTLKKNFFFLFFLSRFSFMDTDNSQDSRGREGTILFQPTRPTSHINDLYPILMMRDYPGTITL